MGTGEAVEARPELKPGSPWAHRELPGGTRAKGRRGCPRRPFRCVRSAEKPRYCRGLLTEMCCLRRFHALRRLDRALSVALWPR